MPTTIYRRLRPMGSLQSLRHRVFRGEYVVSEVRPLRPLVAHTLTGLARGGRSDRLAGMTRIASGVPQGVPHALTQRGQPGPKPKGRAGQVVGHLNSRTPG